MDKFRKIFKIFWGKIKSTVKITNIGMSEHIAGYKLIFGKKLTKYVVLRAKNVFSAYSCARKVVFRLFPFSSAGFFFFSVHKFFFRFQKKNLWTKILKKLAEAIRQTDF